MIDAKEHATTELIENIFNKVIFRDNDDVFINSQQPPWDESRKACDIVIKYAIEGSYDLNILCFVECKRTKKTTPYDLGVVENQALRYCAEHLQQNSGVPFVYACTACGAHLRLWKYAEGTGSLQGFWCGSTVADWASYASKVFEVLVSRPITDGYLVSCSIRTSNSRDGQINTL